MIAVALVLVVFAILLGVVLVAAAAWLRAEDALRSLGALSRRLADVESRLGIDRPAVAPAPRAEAQPKSGGETSLEERGARLAERLRQGDE